VHSLYTILGIPENSNRGEVDSAYRSLRLRLSIDDYEPGSIGYVQCQQALLSIENAYNTLTDPVGLENYRADWRRQFHADDDIQPKLGQLCVAAGVITFEELERAVETQQRLDLPLGQILQEKRLITQAELDGLLLGQQLINLPPESPHSIGQRLMALGLVTEDMVRIVLIEQRTFDRRLGELLVAHGWVDKRLLETILQDNTVCIESKMAAS
jgi:hypothetical protein